ncbi:MAG TPA: hypothetical protein VF178_01755 [Gemmatimonadaceae bacterium]
MIQYIDVHAMLQQSVAGFYGDLVTRPTGRAVRESIETALRAGATEYADQAVALIDFSGVGCIDYSCADEIVAKLLRDRGMVLVLRGISDGHREAIEPVLQGHGLAAVLANPDGTLDALGRHDVAAALLEELVARRLAARSPDGVLALTFA